MTTSDKDTHNAADAPVKGKSALQADIAPNEIEHDEEVEPEDDGTPPKPGLLALLLSPFIFLLGSRRVYGDDVIDPRSARDIAVDEGKEIVIVVAIAVVLVLMLRTLLFQPFTIPSASMEPNLYQGDYIIVSKWDYGISKYSLPLPLPIIKGRLFNHMPERGDIVVFKLPRDPKQDYIKRVVGLPGDKLQMRHDQLYINDVAVPNTVVGTIDAEDSPTGQATEQRESLPNGRVHLMQDMATDGPVDDTDVYTVPAGHYFMMGDNRDNSEDSRFPMATGGVDYVPAENLEGRAVLILMSWKEGSSLWKPWTWLNFHWDRFGKALH